MSAPRNQLVIIVGDWFRDVWYRQVCIFLTMPRSAPWYRIAFCVTVSWQIRSRFRTAVSRHVSFSWGSHCCRRSLWSDITSASLSSSSFSFFLSSASVTESWNAVSSSSQVVSFFVINSKRASVSALWSLKATLLFFRPFALAVVSLTLPELTVIDKSALLSPRRPNTFLQLLFVNWWNLALFKYYCN